MVNLGNIASLEKWDEVVELVDAEKCDIESKADGAHDSSGMGYTALLYAAYFNKKEMFSFLVQRGANVHAVDANSKSGLHIAAKYGSAMVVRQLLLEGVNPNQRDRWGRVPRDLTTDRRSICIDGTKQLTQADLREVDRVFDKWSDIKGVIDSKGVDGLKSMSDLGGDLGVEATHYLSLLGQNTETRKDIQKQMPQVKKQVKKEILADVPDEIDVFVSYCWADKKVVRKTAELLTKNGLKIWIDIGQMGGGDELYTAIDKGLRSAKLVVCCVSPRYAESVNCRREVSLASDLKKNLIPIIVNEKSLGAWPPVGPMGFLLTGKLYINMTDAYDDAVEQLGEAIDQHLESS